MKTFILLLLLSSSAYSQECIFDEASYKDFIGNYATTHKNSKVLDDGITLVVSKNDQQLVITGGGCDHLGGKISVKSHLKLNEAQFLKKITALSEEYATWLIDIKQLKSALRKKSWEKLDNIYRVNLNEMTVFEASQDSNGTIDINFYIN